MDEQTLRKALTGVPLADIRYFQSVDSTNSKALEWAQAGAKEYSLVIAESQTGGRGRLNRNWVTTPGSSLAFSLILFPTPEESKKLPLFSPLGALAVCNAIKSDYKFLDAKVKWPNDVLINRRKVAGILAESSWLGSEVQFTVLGIGINISSDSVPTSRTMMFPATSIENDLERPINRMNFLVKILQSIIYLRKRLLTSDFINNWNDQLAFLGEWITVDQGSWSFNGKLVKVDENGILHLLTQNGSEVSIAFGDVHIRLLEDK